MNIDMSRQVDALGSLLKEKGLFDDQTHADYEHKVTEEWLPKNGAKLCAKAWTDPAFKAFLLADGKAAAASLGFMMPEHHGSLVVKENTASLQNVICCTLCSCTAFTIIGMAPGWYKDLDYRARIVREARKVLSEMGLTLPERIDIKVWDTTTDTRYMILPMRPPQTEGWTEEQLASLITKDSLIGVTRLEPPFSQLPSLNDVSK
ncbi:cobalt-containing nitrile hydratase subunit alpha [Pandoraea eparura]|uniref:Cobalt-containing nitrile hydratase subunit alpha n=1 Tax=Pandoraea eparura TaxID=2508291 RepID=A0A5E4U3P4_9BURK|nr:nitrile hydratase subunit alpha [Pandoraea eparura]VVD94710.1 cobalt-containing nitrile hydratase subunit alpha [Pandoraea eparura]